MAGRHASRRGIVAGELWDDDARYTLAVRQVEVARSAGALVQSQYALNFLAWIHSTLANSPWRRGCSTRIA